VELKLKCGAVALVDEDCPHLDYDWEQLATGHVGAFTTDENGEPIVVLLNRLILPVATGWIVKHIDGRKLDNRRANLQAAKYEPRRPRGKGANKTSVSGILGVQHIPKTCPRRPWRAQIHVDNHNYHLGAFPTKEEAIAVRRAAELAFFGELRCATTPA
jgi:hypothetical protein